MGKKKKNTKPKMRKAENLSLGAFILSIICGADCDYSLPEVSFADCNPEVNESQIQKIYLAKGNAADFSDWTDPSEWASRISASSTDADAIREIVVIGDKPKPEVTEKTISLNRRIQTNKKHTVNFEIDESNATNHNFVRNAKCMKEVKFWYETASGHLFGGNTGITAQFEVDMALSRADGDLILYPGTLKWDSDDLEERIVSPIAA